MTFCALRRDDGVRNARFPVLAVAALLLALFSMPAAADTIHPGIVIDRDRDVVYAADRGGIAHALSVTDGASQWRSTVEAYPLGLLAGRLIALGTPETAGEAVLVALDPADGRVLQRLDVPLAPGVTAQFVPLPRKQFEVHAIATSDALEIHWLYRSQPLRGALLADADGQPVVEPPRSREQQGRLTLRIDGDELTASADGRAESMPFAAIPAPAETRIAGIDGTQWLASDRGSVAVVHALEDARFGIRHRFEVHAPDGSRLGEFEAPHGWLPFVAHAGLVLYRIDPIMVDTPETGRVTHGSRLIARDLSTGEVRWSFDALERRYFGPLPP
jgi:hypothetical protein